MLGSSLQHKEIGPRVSNIDSERPSIEQSIRSLVSCAVDVREISNDGEQERVVLDVDVDGARYLLIRLPAASRNCTVLSSREQEIVRMVAEGHPNKVIGAILNISAWTVGTHLRRIYAKLGVNSRAAMVAQSLEVRSRRERVERRGNLKARA
jgi:DNA-binding CsgD family transcriptional regulator